MKKLAITGGLSCGKSSVCRFLSELGAYVISADKIVHHLLSSDIKLGQEIIKLLGTKILVEQKISRSLIAQVVFKDHNLLKELEKILHPAVYDEIDREYHLQKNKTPHPLLFVVEVPLLFESNGQKYFDYTVVVVANEQTSMKRFNEVHSSTFNEYQQRVTRQLPLTEKVKLADEVIINEGSLAELEMKTVKLYKKLTVK